MPKINILAIDGGGMMGVIPARILSYIDGSVTNPIESDIASLTPGSVATLSDYFSYVAGTSTGALVAVGLTVPTLSGTTKNANEIFSMYVNNATSIFPGSPTLVDVLTSNETEFANCTFADDNGTVTTGGLASVIAAEYGAPEWAGCFYYIENAGWVGSSVGGGTDYYTDYLDFKELHKTPSIIPSSQVVPAYLSGAASTTLLIPSFNGNTAATATASTFPPVLTQVANTGVPPGPVILTNTTQVVPAGGSGTTTEDISVYQACLMTSACPMVLPPVPSDLQFGNLQTSASSCNYFLDGGVWANNPTQAALLYVQQQLNQINAQREENNQEPYTINCIISIGCGTATEPTTLNYGVVQTMGGGIIPVLGNGWMNYTSETGAKPVNALDATIASGTTVLQANEMASYFSGIQYYRLDPILAGGSAPFWSSDDQTLTGWQEAADSAVQGWNTKNSEGVNVWQEMISAITAVV